MSRSKTAIAILLAGNVVLFVLLVAFSSYYRVAQKAYRRIVVESRFPVQSEKFGADTAADYAVAAGVQYGGAVDSGQSSNLLVGYDASGIIRHTGIRSSRPQGAYLFIKVAPL